MTTEERRDELGMELIAWRRLREQFDITLPGTGYLILDANERVIERIDRPRVAGMAVLQYQPPIPARRNWTLFDEGIAKSAVPELDRAHAAFSPHRVVHIVPFLDGRIAATETAFELVSQSLNCDPGPDLEDEEDLSPGLRP